MRESAINIVPKKKNGLENIKSYVEINMKA